MTTITIDRELLEQAIGEKNVPRRQVENAILAIRAALAAPATVPATTQIEDHTLDRLLDAWDTTVLPKHRDGAMQEWMEALRHEYRTCPDNSVTGRVASLDFGLDPAAPAPDDRHRQELLAMEITLQNMAERHTQELAAYELTVANLRAELAKPEQEESFIPDWANYRQGVADGKAGSPKWHDVPTEPGLWMASSSNLARQIDEYDIAHFAQYNDPRRWFGPIPPDGDTK